MLRTLNGHGSLVRSVAFDSNDMVASGSEDGTVKLWNKEYGNLERNIDAHEKTVRSIAFDAENLLASGSAGKTIKI